MLFVVLAVLGLATGQTVPTVISSIPTADTTNFPVDGRVPFELAFSIPMDRTYTSQAFSLTPARAFTSSWNSEGTVLTVRITGNLYYGTNYVMQLSTRARSSQEVPIAAPYVISFRTIYETPVVTFSAPSNGAVVAPTDSIRVIFNIPMDPAFTGAACSLTPAAPYQTSWDPGASRLTLTPQPPLQPGQYYTFKINAAVARSYHGVPLAFGVDNTFRIAPRPFIVTTLPINEDMDVPINSAVQVTFNVDMDTSATQTAFSSTPPLQCQFNWIPNPPLVSSVMLCTPSVLQYGTTYNITISTAAVSSIGLAMAQPYIFFFSTVAAPPPPPPPVPRVVVFAPLNGATNVNPSAPVVVTFSEPMDATSTQSAFSLTPTSSMLFSWNPSGTVFTAAPQSPLPLGTLIAVGISTWARSRQNAHLATPLAFQYTTSVVPAVVASVPVNGSTSVSRYADFRVLFNVPMDQNSTVAAMNISPWAPFETAWSTDSTLLSINPHQALLPLTTYVLTVSTEAMSQSRLPLGAPYKSMFETSS